MVEKEERKVGKGEEEGVEGGRKEENNELASRKRRRLSFRAGGREGKSSWMRSQHFFLGRRLCPLGDRRASG